MIDPLTGITSDDHWYQYFNKPQEKQADLQDIRTKAGEDNLWFMGRHLVIATKKRKEQKLIPNWTQQRILAVFQAFLKAGIPIRLDIGKSRQRGSTTINLGRAFTLWFSERNMNIIVQAHTKPVTTNLFKGARRFYVNLDKKLQIPLERSNKQELIMEMAFGGSQLFLNTAGSVHEARAQTIHGALNSECAFYSDLDTTLEALEGSVPEDDPLSFIVNETTSFGSGTPWHKHVKAARPIIFDNYGQPIIGDALSGDTAYYFLFLEWAGDPECQMNFSSPIVKEKFREIVFAKAPFLKARMEHYNLTIEQICWYFKKCIDSYKGEWLRMQQEFPCSADESFLATGLTIIPTEVIEFYDHITTDGVMYDPLQEWNADPSTWVKNQYLVRDTHTYLEVWDMPRPNRHYVVTVDTASGMAKDNSCIKVHDIATQNLVAELHGKIEPKRLATYAMRIGNAYNTAVICVELNGLGLSTQSHIDGKYFHLYRRRSRGTMKGVQVTDKVGWHMDEDLRWVILANLRRIMMERMGGEYNPKEFIPSKGLVSELKTFIQTDAANGKPQATQGCNDDRVMTEAIGVFVCLEELLIRPDITPLAQIEDSRDNKTDPDPEEIMAMVEDPNWTGLEKYEKPTSLLSGPFCPDVQLSDEDYYDDDD